MILNSPYITGSLTVTGNSVFDGSITVAGGISGSSAVSASYALSASFASNAATATSASFASNAAIATSASFASNAATATSASQAQNAVSSSFASNAATATSASFASNAATATSASQAQNAVSSSFAANANLLDGKDSTEFAITGSNIFTGIQYNTDSSNPNGFGASASIYTDGGVRITRDAYVSGTIYVNNLTVFGTQSISYVTSSQLNISTNIISVNTDTPSVRFGGLSVYDSGSTGLTGSILWDSERDHWVYSNPSGSTYNSAMIMSGPRNSGSLGNEQGTINNVIVKGQGGDHVTSSQMIDDGTTVRIPGNFQVTGSTIITGALTGSSATFSGFTGIGELNPRSVLQTTSTGLGDNGGLTIKNSGSGGASWFIWPTATINGEGAGKLIFSSNTVPNVLTLASGAVGINNVNPTSTALAISANVGSSQTASAVSINAVGSGGFQRGVVLLNSALATGESLLYMVGREQSSKQAGQLYFHYVGSASNSNRLSLGIYAVDDIVNIMASGNVLIGTTTDSGYKFDVNGTGRFSGAVTISTNNSPGLDIRKDSSTDNRYIRLSNTQASAKSWDLINQTNANSNRFSIYNSTDNVEAFYITPAGGGVFASFVNMSGGSSNGQFSIGIGGLGLDRTQANNGIWFNGGTDTNHVLWNDYYGGPTTRPLPGTGFDGIKWNVYRGFILYGGGAGASTLLSITNSSSSTEDHTVALYASGTKRFETTTSGIWVNNTITSPGNLILTSTLNSYIRPASSYWAFVDTGNGLSTGASQKIAIGSTTSADGGLNVRGYGVADSSTNFGFILDRGTKIAWTNGGNATTGEFLYSQQGSPYGVTIHSGPYNAISCPNTGNVFIVYEGGNLGVGTTGPSYKLHVEGTAYATGAAGALSDIRHKNNVVSTSKGLNEILQLNPVEFEWNEDKIVDDGMKGTHIGFIAQEVKDILPNTVLIESNEENTLGLKNNEFIPILVKAIQEQQTLITALQEKLERNNII
jgi:hypothetical protein